MNKTVLAIIATIVIVAAGTIGYTVSKNAKDVSTKPLSSGTDTAGTAQKSSSESGHTRAKKACELLTPEDAKSLIGSNAVQLEGSGSENNATTDAVTVDNCSYSADGATLGDMKQLVIQVHHGGSAQVKQAFENYKKDYPGEPVPEIGGTAYFATETKQVNILQGENWLFVGGGSMNGGDAANKELAIKTMQVALKKL